MGIARVDDDEECYVLFKAKNESVPECCIGLDCDSSTNFKKCQPENQYSLSSEQSSKSFAGQRDICKLDIFAVNETSQGKYKMFTLDHDPTVDGHCHVIITPKPKKNENK